jgi:hypothetical protein
MSLSKYALPPFLWRLIGLAMAVLSITATNLPEIASAFGRSNCANVANNTKNYDDA